MTSEKPTRNQRADGDLAEIQVADKRYRKALNGPFLNEAVILSDEQVEEHMAHRDAADTIIHSVLSDNPNLPRYLQNWEMRRKASEASLAGTALGSFNAYFLDIPSESVPSSLDKEDIGEGKSEVVLTNDDIIIASRHHKDPLEFFDTALGVIDRNKNRAGRAIGPENYATSLKYFSDKYRTVYKSEDPADTPMDLDKAKDLVDESLEGFVAISRRDTPNFIEMTNIYASIAVLPDALIDKKFSKPLIEFSLGGLQDYNTRTVMLMITAMERIDISGYEKDAANVISLGLQKIGRFETTLDMKRALRAIDHLSVSPETDRALATLFEMRGGLEKPLELDGIDEMNARLLHIVNEVTQNARLTGEAKEIARACVNQATAIVKRKLTRGVTSSEKSDLKAVYDRIVANYKAI